MERKYVYFTYSEITDSITLFNQIINKTYIIVISHLTSLFLLAWTHAKAVVKQLFFITWCI